MKLNYDHDSKNPTYFIQTTIRNGKKVSSKNVYTIGKHNDLLAICDDPLEYAKQKVKEFNEQIKSEKVEMNITIDFDDKLINQGNIASKSLCKNIGYFILKKIYNDLDIDNFFIDIKQDKKYKYDPSNINLFLTVNRILDPGSKLYSFNNKDKLYGNFDFSYQDIHRYLDLLSDHYDEYISFLFEASNKVIKRDTSVCYFDCTNYYFENQLEDEDYYDEVTGELIKGLLKYGISKEHRTNPIVQMGLFTDKDGIPISMCINSGSDNESICAIPTETKLIKMIENKEIIYCADAGLGYTNIRNFNNMGGRKFVVTQSIKKMGEVYKQAVFNDFDYRYSLDGKSLSLDFMKNFDRKDENNIDYYNGYVYKSIEVDKLIDLGLYEDKVLKNGKIKQVKSKGTLKQRIIITYSRKRAEYQKAIRDKQVKRAQTLLKNIDPDTYKKGPNDITRFIKCAKVAGKKDYSIDQDRIDEETMYDGFYAVATNIFDESEQDIINIQAQRYKIEDCFRVMKTNFEGRPVFHYTRNKIIAHFMICYTALLIYRLLQTKLDRNKTHFSDNQIIQTLKNMNVLEAENVYYKSCYTGSDVLTVFEQIYSLGLDKKNYLPKTLNKFLKKY